MDFRWSAHIMKYYSLIFHFQPFKTVKTILRSHPLWSRWPARAVPRVQPANPRPEGRSLAFPQRSAVWWISVYSRRCSCLQWQRTMCGVQPADTPCHCPPQSRALPAAGPRPPGCSQGASVGRLPGAPLLSLLPGLVQGSVASGRALVWACDTVLAAPPPKSPGSPQSSQRAATPPALNGGECLLCPNYHICSC